MPGYNRNFGHIVVGQAPIARANIEGHENPIENPIRDGAANAAMDDDEDDNQRDGGVSFICSLLVNDTSELSVCLILLYLLG